MSIYVCKLGPEVLALAVGSCCVPSGPSSPSGSVCGGYQPPTSTRKERMNTNTPAGSLDTVQNRRGGGG